MREFRRQFINELAAELAPQMMFLADKLADQEFYENVIKGVLYDKLPAGTAVLYPTKKYSQ